MPLGSPTPLGQALRTVCFQHPHGGHCGAIGHAAEILLGRLVGAPNAYGAVPRGRHVLLLLDDVRPLLLTTTRCSTLLLWLILLC